MERAELIAEIKRLKKEKNAVIVAHSYQLDEIQELADLVGDSYALSAYCAKQTDADVIVFCGVHFMAESAKILSPNKTVLLPEVTAGCPMADMVTPEALREAKKQHPNATVVCYINSTAAVKAECDVCCTSSNAVKIVKALDTEEILFVPDKNLSRYVATQVPEKTIHLWEGFCPSHNAMTEEDVKRAKEEHPNAVFLVHPECTPEVCAMADYIGSTKQIIDYVKESRLEEFLIGTELGVMYALETQNPGKKFFPLHTELVCSNMKKTTLESVYLALSENRYEITLDEDVIQRAKGSLENMLQLAK